MDKVKSILFVVENLRGGGAEKVLLTLLRHLDYQRYEVSLCMAYPEGVYLDCLPPSVRLLTVFDGYHSICRKSFRYYKRYGVSWLLRRQLKKKIAGNYDVVISFLEGRALLMHRWLVGHGKKNISWIHCDLSTYHWTRAAFPNFRAECDSYAQMDRLVFVSRSAQAGFEKLFSIQTPKVCLYNPIDIQQIRVQSRETVIPHPCFTVTAIGTVNRVKGFDKLAVVAKRFKDLNCPVRFQIVGEEDKDRSLQRLCEEMEVADRFVFTGFQSNPYPYLLASDVYVSTSLSEGFSLTICEAMCLGIPVVATATAGATEVLDHGKFGILVEHDAESIFLGIWRFYKDRAYRQNCAAKALQRVDMFRVDDFVARFCELLDK